jgi:hypothetical protein
MTGHAITLDGETAFVGNASELMVALDVLHGEHDRLILDQLGFGLAEIIDSSQGLYSILRVLAPPDQLLLLDFAAPALPDIIRKPGPLRDILAMLAEVEVTESLLRKLGSEGLRAVTGSAADLSGILEWVYGSCDRLILELLGAEFLRELIINGHDLSLVLYSLKEDTQLELLELLGWERVLSLVHDRTDLAHLMRALPDRISEMLLSHLPADRLKAMIRTDRDWDYVYGFLDDDEAAHLSARLGRDGNAQ